MIPRWAFYVGGVVALALALWWLRADAYADGKRAENERWEQAIETAKKKSDAAAGQADEAAVEREEEFADQVKAEKEKIDATIDEGGDPFSVMFPSS